MTRPSFWSHARAVLDTELKGLVRDRRAVFSAFVLPMVIYPLIFLGQSWLERISRQTLEARTVHVALDLSRAPEVAVRLSELVALEVLIEPRIVDAQALHALESEIDAGGLASIEHERAAVTQILALAGGSDVLLVARTLEKAPHLGLRLYYDETSDVSNEGRKRLEKVLDTLYQEMRKSLLSERIGDDPARGLEFQALDVASAADTSGATLGRLLPLIAVIVFLSGGSYAALSAFAGEREAGTLETLLVQPVPSIAVAAGKFTAVLLVGLLTLVLNAGSSLVCIALGLGQFPGSSESGARAALSVGAGRLFSGAFLFLPAAVLLCALLCVVCGRARTFREGQHLLLPLMLVAMLPTLLATQQDIQMDVLLAAVPLAGPSLALRDALRGELALPMVAWMFVANSLWAGLVLTRIARVLDAEKLLQSRGDENEVAARAVQSRYALRWAAVAVFTVYVAGGAVQAWSPVWGLAATLWILLPALATLSLRGTMRRAREGWRAALGVRAPALHHALGAILLAPALAVCAQQLFEWQKAVLPLPIGFEDVALPIELEGLSPLASFALLALSPAICEELFFRGAFLSGLRRDLPGWRCMLFEGLFFGAVHASIYRFAPTAALGAVLTFVTLRSRSLVPAVLLHAAYNGILVMSDVWPVLAQPELAWLGIPALGLWLVPLRRASDGPG